MIHRYTNIKRIATQKRRMGVNVHGLSIRAAMSPRANARNGQSYSFSTYYYTTVITLLPTTNETMKSPLLLFSVSIRCGGCIPFPLLLTTTCTEELVTSALTRRGTTSL
jgi:hypothetical protein